MNKKIIIAFGISVFLGLAYLAYRKTDFGKSLKIKWIITKLNKKRAAKNLTWEFPDSVIQDTKAELSLLDFDELELVEDYVDSCLQRKGLKQSKEYREKMKDLGIYNKTELPALEHMLYNLWGLSKGYLKGRHRVEPDNYPNTSKENQ